MKTLYLHTNWQYRKSDEWHHAVVPGNIHLDLIANGVIPDPYYRTNERDQQWIGETDWEYRTYFEIPPDLRQSEHAELVFDGLDTYADIYLNDVRIGTADNMYCGWRLDISPHIKTGPNELRIYFHSVIKKTLPLYERNAFVYGANNSQPEPKLSMYTRKPGYHFGWDWGPRLLTCGIWRPVYLEFWNGVRLDNIRFIQKSLNDYAAELRLEAEFIASSSVIIDLILTSPTGEFAPVTKQMGVKPGLNVVEIDFNIESPRKWWCNGLGEPFLYELKLEAVDGDEHVGSWNSRVGLRTVELVHDTDEFGKCFYFKINGVPVFIKGANCIPADYFIPRITENDYRTLLGSAAAANLNMVRLWGGAIYEENIFYDLCDEMGILVWQDFMFACALYPADDVMIRRITDEAEYNIKRLRNHPSLALWCGNNEIDEARHTWGWQKRYGYTPEVNEKINYDYDAIFNGVLPQAVRRLDPGRAYWPSSPKYGFVDPRNRTDGDMHYWGVWFLNHPREKLNEYLPRFMSEYGLQSMPEMRSIRAFSIPSDWYLDSEVMLAHQRQYPNLWKGQVSGGYDMMLRYLERESNIPKEFEHLTYVTQLLQADYLRYAIELHRRHKPYCMGTMYWQLNDLWPVTSWSTVDYYGRWKAAHYAVRQAYNPILVSTKDDGEFLDVWIISDLQKGTDGRLEITLSDFDGNILFNDSANVVIPPNSSDCYYKVRKTDLLEGKDPSRHVWIARMCVPNGLQYENLFYFDYTNGLKLDNPYIESEVCEFQGSFLIGLTARRLAKNVQIRTNCDGSLSDNYFDLLPGHKKVIKFEPRMEWDRTMSLLHYYNVLEKMGSIVIPK
jgi:beta-mannosidase